MNLFCDPIIADIDGDGINEVIATDKTSLFIWRPPSRSPLFVQELSDPRTFTTVAVGDLDNDGITEIVTGSRSTLTVFKFDNGLTKVAEFQIPSMFIIQDVCIGSVRKDGSNRLFVAGWSTLNRPTSCVPETLNFSECISGLSQGMRRIHVFSLAGGRVYGDGYIVTPITRIKSLRLADIDGDGIDEVIASGSDSGGAERGEDTVFPFVGIAAWKYEDATASYTKIAELNNQWRTVTREFDVPEEYAKNYEPPEKRFESIDGALGMRPEAMNVGDIDGDGVNEIIVTSGYSFQFKRYDPDAEKARISILVFERGQFVFKSQIEVPQARSHFSGVGIGDVDGDGINEFTDSGNVLLKWNPEDDEYGILEIPHITRVQSEYAIIGQLNL